MTGPNTRDKILDAAEHLFANKGLKETSVRDITSYAQVHLAAVNYHFQTKNGLLEELIQRRIKPLNQQRLELLDQYENRLGIGRVPVENALYGLIAPVIRMSFEAPDFLKIAGQIVSHPDEETYMIFISNFQPVFAKFREAVSETLSHISEEDLMWRMHFITGAMVHTCTNHHVLTLLSHGVCILKDQEEIIEKLITFCAAGLKADVRNKRTNKDK